MPVIRNNKEVFTTSLPSDLLENLRQYCYSNNKKINEVLENMITSCLKPGENKESKM